MTKEFYPRLLLTQTRRHCLSRLVQTLDREETKLRLYQQRGQGGFRMFQSGAWPAAETFFDICHDAWTLFVTVMTVETGNMGLLQQGMRRATEGVEIFFDPFCDQVGYLQFGTDCDGHSFEVSHWPYRDPAKNSYCDPRWKVTMEQEVQPPDVVRFYFFEFELARIRAGNCIGFNVGRSQFAAQENSSWNLTSGIGFGDPGCFGKLWIEPPAVGVSSATVDCHDQMVESINLTGIRSKEPGCRIVATLLQPDGKTVFESKPENLDGEVAATSLLNFRPGSGVKLTQRGRYRLCFHATNAADKDVAVDPDEVFFDWVPDAKQRFQFQGTYDWPDNFGNVPYSPEMLQQEMAWYKNCGIERLYWLDYPVETWLDRKGWSSNIGKTHELFGEKDLLPAAVQAAHANDQELVTIFKPFDQYAETSFIQNHPEFSIGSFPYQPEKRRPIAEICIYQRDDSPFSFAPDQILLWQSEDNRTYSPVTFAASQVEEVRIERPEAVSIPFAAPASSAATSVAAPTRTARCLSITGLKLNSPYLAVTWNNGNPDHALRNRLYLLVAVLDSEGEAVHHVVVTKPGDISENGFDFGPRGKNSPSWGRADAGQDVMTVVPGDSGAIGIAMTLPESFPGFLEPTCRQAHEFWLDQLKRGIDAGADAVSLRIAHHVGCIDWTSYMFAKPVIEAFKTRYERLPAADNEDLTRIRKLRGEAYTEFLRQASRLAHDAGVRFQHHIENRMLVPPEYDTYCQIHWDWQTWIREGLVDEIDLKYIGPDHADCYREIVPLARRHGVRVNGITAYPEPRSRPRSIDESPLLVDRAFNAGLDGIDLYELWLYHRLTDRGTLMTRGGGEGIIRNMKTRIDVLLGE